jgi:hypothetical protein
VPLDSAKFTVERFAMYKQQAEDFQGRYKWEKETHPNVVARFNGYDLGDSGMWDEDPWTVRAQFNPVKRAFRTCGLVRGPHPYAIVVDDIQKDDKERLYEWTMMLSADTIAIDIHDEDNPHAIGPRQTQVPSSIYTDIILGREGILRESGSYKPAKGEPLLLVRVLQCATPCDPRTYDSRPQPRLETVEKKDVRSAPGGATWGMDRRLVVPSRSVSPDFKILLYPYRHDIDPLPVTTLDKGRLSIKWDDQEDAYDFSDNGGGRTLLELRRNGKILLRTR